MLSNTYHLSLLLGGVVQTLTSVGNHGPPPTDRIVHRLTIVNHLVEEVQVDYGGASAICTESRRERMCRRAFAASDGSTDHDQQRRIHSAMLCARRVTRVSGQHACVVTTHFDDAAQDGTLPTATYIKAHAMPNAARSFAMS